MVGNANDREAAEGGRNIFLQVLAELLASFICATQLKKGGEGTQTPAPEIPSAGGGIDLNL